MTAIAWFRRDLRLSDNPAWSAATSSGPVVALFVLEPELLAGAGHHRKDFFLAALRALDAELVELGGRLHVIDGPAAAALPCFAEEIAATSVHVNADPSPFAVDRDRAVDQALPFPLDTHWGNAVQPPGAVLTGKGTLSRVFTPFYKRWAATPVSYPPPAATPTFRDLPGGPAVPEAATTVPSGAHHAHERLEAFIDAVDAYPDDRDIPSIVGTSMLSADLHAGTIGPREIIDAVGDHSDGRLAFVRQLAWRDWYTHLLFERPEMKTSAMDERYDRVAWLTDADGFDAWNRGRTGYPLVDAGMRQLAETGWMHNRVRMVAASFLVKHLLIDWREGERWFRRHLIDGDLAQNVGNWQWVAGTGADAAPYFRVFNPIAQSRKFDPGAAYIRRWVPELAALDDKAIHEPWEQGPLDLAAAGITLGDDYPYPIVDHREARERCLAAYKAALG